MKDEIYTCSVQKWCNGCQRLKPREMFRNQQIYQDENGRCLACENGLKQEGKQSQLIT